uniref:Major capsid protein VP1 n=1 Tax=Canine parvovirus type 2 TaxID=10788 RepID=A0A3G1HH26_PAVC|nr:major capsid protein VP1 [Canine parvovirus]
MAPPAKRARRGKGVLVKWGEGKNLMT